MKVEIINRLKKFKVSSKKINVLFDRLSEFFKIEPRYSITVTFAGIDTMRNLNRDFRQKDRPTDVLSFPLYDTGTIIMAGDKRGRHDIESGMPLILGDIILCPDYILKNNVLEANEKFQYEVLYLLIHGFLHLIGHDHDEDDYENSEMKKAAEKFIKKSISEKDYQLLLIRGLN
ncbi:MAG: rRNA maturation RNase YbeY [Candidatus Wallbacteria bacterium]